MSNPTRSSDATPAFHRRVEVSTRETGSACEARGVVEDDFHHFRVVVRAEAGTVSEAFSHALRHPNSLCPSAGARLAEIVGMPLNESSAAVLEVTDARQQCTHQIDLAGVAVALLARGVRRRRYDATVPDRHDGRTTATLARDGELFFRWDLEGTTILRPYAGRDIGSGFTGFARSLSPDEGEAALVLRRAVYVSAGRSLDLTRAGRTGPVGGCWAWQPERMDQIVRLPTKLDFSGRAQELALGDEAWLAFTD